MKIEALKLFIQFHIDKVIISDTKYSSQTFRRFVGETNNSPSEKMKLIKIEDIDTIICSYNGEEKRVEHKKRNGAVFDENFKIVNASDTTEMGLQIKKFQNYVKSSEDSQVLSQFLIINGVSIYEDTDERLLLDLDGLRSRVLDFLNFKQGQDEQVLRFSDEKTSVSQTHKSNISNFVPFLDRQLMSVQCAE